MKKETGFSLIELMIVVAVVGVLAAIAYPSYIDYLVRANRAAAQSFMLELASKQERYVLDQRSYYSGAASGLFAPGADVSKNYEVTITGVTASTYTIQAAPKDTQLARDTKCATLTLNQAGQKTISGTGSLAECWKS